MDDFRRTIYILLLSALFPILTPAMARRRFPVISVTPAMVLGLALGGCHHYQRYSAIPAPSSDSSAASYAARSLEDSSLQALLVASKVPDEGSWLPQQLALAALYFRSDLDLLRAEVATAHAAVITAGAQPPIGVTATPEKAASPDEGRSSTWTVELGVDLRVETGGKRGARIARARAAAAVTALELSIHGWDIASAVADAALAATTADSVSSITDSIVEGATRVVDGFQWRYRQGEVGATELVRAAMDLADAKLAAADAQRTRVNAWTGLAHVIGLSPARVAGLSLASIPSSCGVLDSVSVESLRARALHTRADIGAALERYMESEANFRLAIAEQYPDIHLGPAFLWDEGIARWVVAFGLPDVVLSHLRGPIAEARARRSAEGVRVIVAQDSVLGEVDAAISGCRAARLGLEAADSVARATQDAMIVDQRSYERGENGSLEMARAALAAKRTSRAIWDARQGDAIAGLALQHAVGAWLTGPNVLWPDIAQPPRHLPGAA